MLKDKIFFQTELGVLYNGDCLEFLPQIDSESVDLVFADPPFNLGKNYGSRVNDSLQDEEYLKWCFSWIDELVRILKPGGSFFLYNLPKWNIHLAHYMSKQLTFRHWIAVDIKFSLPIPGRLYPSHYSLLYFVKGKRPKTFNPPRLPIETCSFCGKELKDYGGYKNKMNPNGVNLTDVWRDLSPVRHKKYKNRASNELPLKMLDRILDIATVEGDVVLDPFGGSGTTYIAAELKKRHWIGLEIDKESCEVIQQRFQQIKKEEEHLLAIRREINTLFTPEALELRKKFGHDNSKYRINGEKQSTETTGTLFELIENNSQNEK